jgi:AcrR family transcriptional regulator
VGTSLRVVKRVRPDEPGAERDGRRLRSQDSRERIVTAMLEIMRGGELAPSAEHVAARAEVGLRTVFRHFKDMDSLYRELSSAVEGEIRADFEQPFKSTTWRGRLVELVERRAAIFEKIAPYKRAEMAHRHRSRFLEDDSKRLFHALRDILKSNLPAEIVRDSARFEALDLLMSFESWNRLRQEQGLSARRVREVIIAAVKKISE